jgi:hypothetical protein
VTKFHARIIPERHRCATNKVLGAAVASGLTVIQQKTPASPPANEEQEYDDDSQSQ